MQFVVSCQIILVLFILKINKMYATSKIYILGEKVFYINSDQEFSWFDGLSECLKRNMTLATIDNHEKSTEINTLVFNTFRNQTILWVGGAFSGFTGNYFWISRGQPFSFTYWSGRRPHDQDKQKYCVNIGRGNDMKWNVNECSSKRGFICQQQDLTSNQVLERKLLEFQQELNKAKVTEEQLRNALKIKDNEIKEQRKFKDDILKQIENQQKFNEKLKNGETLNKLKEVEQKLREDLKLKDNEIAKLKHFRDNVLAHLLKEEEQQTQNQELHKQLQMGTHALQQVQQNQLKLENQINAILNQTISEKRKKCQDINEETKL